MANARISELPAATTPLAGNELAEIVQGGINKQVATSNFGGTTVASQSETNAGSNDTKVVTPLKLKNLDQDTVALSDSSTIDITGPKHTLTSSSATRTFTISFVGDFMFITVTLNATSATYTFPVSCLCKSDGFASGDNTLPLAGVSGDKYDIGIIKNGIGYSVYAQNMGQ